MFNYRAGIGAIILNQAGSHIWLFERADGYGWQWPEGGIDDGEDLLVALGREVYEEVGLKDFVVKAETADFLKYDFPNTDGVGHLIAQGIIGQRKKIFLVECVDNVVFDFNTHSTPEFVSGKLATPAECVLQAVDFKQAMYASALKEFGLL